MTSLKKFKVSTVNKAIAAAGIHGALIRGNGFYQFNGPAFAGCKDKVVRTLSLMNYSIEEWVGMADMLNTESLMAAKGQNVSNGFSGDSINTNLLPDDGSPLTEEDHLMAQIDSDSDDLLEPSIEDKIADLDEVIAQEKNPTAVAIKTLLAYEDPKPAQVPAAREVSNYRLKFFKIEHGAHLQEAMDALTSIGCVIGSINGFDVSFEREQAIIPFSTTMSFKEVKELLAFTGVTL